jgi:hypothetical protein
MLKTPGFRISRTQRLALFLAVSAVAFTAWAGKYHFVYGTPISGLARFEKISWSLSETLLNADEMNGTPKALLHARYPLFMQAAKRDGVLN